MDDAADRMMGPAPLNFGRPAIDPHVRSAP
jgi:hypothetical protein